MEGKYIGLVPGKEGGRGGEGWYTSDTRGWEPGFPVSHKLQSAI